MKQPIVRLTFVEEDTPIDVIGLMGSEYDKLDGWAGLGSGSKLRKALVQDESAAAYRAVLTLFRQRRGETVSYSDVDYDYDALTVCMVDETGREIEPVVVERKVGDEVERSHKTDKKGNGLWSYVDDGSPVPTTAA